MLSAIPDANMRTPKLARDGAPQKKGFLEQEPDALRRHGVACAYRRKVFDMKNQPGQEGHRITYVQKRNQDKRRTRQTMLYRYAMFLRQRAGLPAHATPLAPNKPKGLWDLSDRGRRTFMAARESPRAVLENDTYGVQLAKHAERTSTLDTLASVAEASSSVLDNSALRTKAISA